MVAEMTLKACHTASGKFRRSVRVYGPALSREKGRNFLSDEILPFRIWWIPTNPDTPGIPGEFPGAAASGNTCFPDISR